MDKHTHTHIHDIDKNNTLLHCFAGVQDKNSVKEIYQHVLANAHSDCIRHAQGSDYHCTLSQHYNSQKDCTVCVEHLNELS